MPVTLQPTSFKYKNSNNEFQSATAIKGDTGVGVPTGGTTGQVLSKASGTDYDTEWTTPEQGGVQDVQVAGVSVVGQDGVANVPIASADAFGVVKTNAAAGIDINSETGRLRIASANGGEIRSGSNIYKPIVPSNINQAVFYGLAKAAGDTTQSSIVFDGQYTDSAKSAIQTMLGVEQGVSFVESVSGTAVTITGIANTRYKCGEVSTITITPPSTGTIDILFESGSTAAVLTVPSTVKWPEWFDATALDADTTYELVITDGVYGGVMAWPD